MGYRAYVRKLKKIILVFCNLLHNFVRVDLYQLKKFTSNFVDILDVTKKVKCDSTAAFVFYSSLKLTAFFSV